MDTGDAGANSAGQRPQIKLQGRQYLRPDRCGELTLPKHWRDAIGAGLVMIGHGDHLEIWPAATWDKMISDLPSFGEPPPGLFKDFKP